MTPLVLAYRIIADADGVQRNFRFVSMFGFTMILMASWESIIRFVDLMAWETVKKTRLSQNMQCLQYRACQWRYCWFDLDVLHMLGCIHLYQHVDVCLPHLKS